MLEAYGIEIDILPSLKEGVLRCGWIKCGYRKAVSQRREEMAEALRGVVVKNPR